MNYAEPPITTFGVAMFAYSKTFDITHCRALLGEPAMSIEAGRRDLVAWWRSNGVG
jgi:hypothetical protein